MEETWLSTYFAIATEFTVRCDYNRIIGAYCCEKGRGGYLCRSRAETPLFPRRYSPWCWRAQVFLRNDISRTPREFGLSCERCFDIKQHTYITENGLFIAQIQWQLIWRCGITLHRLGTRTWSDAECSSSSLKFPIKRPIKIQVN